jgi:hypothetical protein
MRHLLILLLLLTTFTAFGQNPNDRRLVQFSGVVVTGDSLEPVPFTSILDARQLPWHNQRCLRLLQLRGTGR